MIGDTPSPAPEPSPFAPTPRTRHRGRLMWVVAGLAFAVGLVAMYYLLPAIDRWRGTDTVTTKTVQTTPAAQQTPAAVASTPPNPVALDALTARAAALDAQLRTVEGRMAATDAASRTASGQARRAEGLLIAFAARRALDRGLSLGYVEAQLRDRFGAEQPQAVTTVIATSRSPVTLADLRGGLSRLAPILTVGSAQDGFFRTVWRELSTLVILRREDTPSARPDDRLDRARTILDGGNVEGALAEVARMPGAAEASNWIDAAKRYIDARRALNTLELAAIGTPLPAEPPPVVQPTPATAPAAPNPAGTLPGA